MAGVSIDGYACLKIMCFTGFDFRYWFAGLGYPMSVTELYWLQVNIGLGNVLCRLANQYTRRFCMQGDSMPHCCLATGRWGAARRRPGTGMARDPAPLPPAWCHEESTSWHDENKVIVTQTPNVTIYWTRMISHCCVMISMRHVHIFMHLQEKAT